MDTYFAPAERTPKEKLVSEIELVSKSPVMSGLLQSIGGLLAILDENRQIIAANDSFLKILGVTDPASILGLRPGEAIDCTHAYEESGGCGTSRYCSTCGAAVAIVSSLKENAPVERLCALTVRKGGEIIDIALSVRAKPIEIDGVVFLLLFLKDISAEQQRAALERTFFHDINNIMVGLLGTSEMLCHEKDHSKLTDILHKSSLRLKNEIDIQKCLLQSGAGVYRPQWQDVSVTQVVEELKTCFSNHSAAKGKLIQFPDKPPAVIVHVDFSLLLRILSNMLINALEASDAGDTVQLWVDNVSGFVSFHVRNNRCIDPDVARRIFQRNFSTKNGAGRGIGTYSMKLFGEGILRGKISFVTSEEEGTVFTLKLPG